MLIQNVLVEIMQRSPLSHFLIEPSCEDFIRFVGLERVDGIAQTQNAAGP